MRWVVAAASVAVVASISPLASAESVSGSLRAAAPSSAKPAEAGTYIVQLAEPPVVAYAGGVAGLRATRPAKGAKIDPASAAVTAYADHLTRRQDAVLQGAGGGRKLYGYTYSFNGFAAELSAGAAAKVSSLPGVLAVSKDEKRSLDTSSTPKFLGLDAAGGLWSRLGGASATGKKTPGPGEDVVVGIIDGGIWPEHPSVSDRDASGKRTYQQIAGWHGRCIAGEAFTAADCNQKLIGARYYNAGWGGNAGIDAQLPHEYNSPRDFGGHGTHTATTAAGNYGVQTTGAAEILGSISGIAPRARIAAYKVCWETDAGGSCFSSDSVAAIDQAVADGVDVLNFSISGTSTNFRDPVEIAFLFAADAGVFVAASAGNSGPTTSTVAHPGPWLTTVAAGTHNRDGQGSVTLGNGASYAGSSAADTGAGPAPLVDSVAVGAKDADPDEVELCYPGALDPSKVVGAIVICKRGVNARTDKSLAVQQAGGVGMILYNSPDNSINADLHFVPTVHVNSVAGTAIKAYAASAGATATIGQATLVYDAPAPYTATFSSRGPLRGGGGDLLKPDLIAPGQDILAGVAPPGNHGRLFDLYSGTSMSSPHVAGLAALLIDLHPDWSPMAVKSALMTTGYDVLDGPSSDPLVIFKQGAGHVRPNSAAGPGLVYDSGWTDWLGFLCGAQPGGGCGGVTPLDPSDYNSPSIAIGALAGTQTVTRKVTNVSGSSATFTAEATGLAGTSVVVSPSSLALAAGATGTFTVTITRTTAPLNSYVGGQLTWSGGGFSVRIPMVVRPVPLAAPAEVSGTGAALSYEVGFGYTGPFSAAPRGLVPAVVTPGTVAQDPDQTFDPGDTVGNAVTDVTIPAGTTYARFAIFDEDVAPGSDLDLYVYQGNTLVGASGGGTSDEQVNFAFANPTASPLALKVYVHGWGVAGGGSSPFVLHQWSVGTAGTGTMAVSAPTSATTGATGTVNLTFSGLAAGTRYLGSVAYSGATGMPNPTIVSVSTP
jgi:hypothetical protein